MNYYQNQYANNQFGSPQYGVPQYNSAPYQQQYIPTPQLNNLCGKVVDSEEIVKIQELMPGQLGVYPKADESCVFVKRWLPSGNSTVITTYVPVQAEESETSSDNTLLSIQQSIEELSNKIDNLSVAPPPAPAPRVSMTRTKSKEA